MDYTSKVTKDDFKPGNDWVTDNKINPEIREVGKVDSNMLSEANIGPLTAPERSEEYNPII